MNEYVLESAQGMATQHPDTFEVATIDRLRDVVEPGVYAKVCIKNGAFQGERIWTEVISVDDLDVKAKFANQPMGFEAELDDPIEFQLHHIYNVTAHDGEELA